MRDIKPAEIKKVREASGLSQAEFAERFQLRVRTLQKWEREGVPEGPAAILLWLIGKIPEQITKALRGF
jgi:putative transcriptional regulator